MKGISFEKKVAKLYQDLGKKGVEHDVHFRHGKVHSQFDISYGLRKRYFVECKYRSTGSVSFQEVATFAAKLSLHYISHKRGVMVTNQSYDERSKVYAKKIGLQLIDGKKLSSMSSPTYRFLHSLF